MIFDWSKTFTMRLLIGRNNLVVILLVGICIKETVTLKSSFIMNTTQIVEQEKIPVGEIKLEEADSSSKCKVEVRYFKYWTKPRRNRVVKPKKVKEKMTQEIRRDRNRTNQRKCRDRKRTLKQLIESMNPPKILPQNPPKNPPLTTAQRSKRYRDKKKNLKKI